MAAAATENDLRPGAAGRFALRGQKFLGWLVFPALYAVLACALRFVMGYSIDAGDLRRARALFRSLARRRSPVLVCANHLTMIDSVILLWAFAGPLQYMLRFSRLCWNVPAIENFAHSFWQRLVTYLAKCLPIDRQGDKEHIDGIFAKLRWLLHRGEYVMLFPEGTRSRSGRFQADEITYGAGRLVQAGPDCDVLCVYLRGEGQESYSDYPRRKERFRIAARLLPARSLESQLPGLRGAREISRSIAAEILAMEKEHFAARDEAAARARSQASERAAGAAA